MRQHLLFILVLTQEKTRAQMTMKSQATEEHLASKADTAAVTSGQRPIQQQ
jgi:transcriptional regulator of met regulon